MNPMTEEEKKELETGLNLASVEELEKLLEEVTNLSNKINQILHVEEGGHA